MGRPRILDEKILLKIAKKKGRPGDIKYSTGLVSRRAHKLGISAEAAMVLIAKDLRIGTSTYQRKLDPAKQAEIRDALPLMLATISSKIDKTKTSKSGQGNKAEPSQRDLLKAAIEYLIHDSELLTRCKDLLLASANYDRAINQATLVLEDRIRKKSKLSNKFVGENLVNNAFNEDLTKTKLRIASNDPDDQRGFTQMLRGIVPAFRNKTHHHVIDDFSRDDAMRVCGFIDVLLHVIDNSVKVK